MNSLIYPQNSQHVWWRYVIRLRVELQTDGHLGTVLGNLHHSYKMAHSNKGLTPRSKHLLIDYP